MGDDGINTIPTADLNLLEWSATRTSFFFTVGQVDVNTSFINPIEVHSVPLIEKA